MRTICFALAAALSPFPTFAAVPYLVADIEPRFVSQGSQPSRFVSLGGRVVFVTDQDSGGIWGTAGALGDPVLLDPGHLRIFSGPTAAGGRAYFSRCGEDGCGLWGTDGTPAGTVRLDDPLQSVAFASLEAAAPVGLPRTLLLANPGSGADLWRTDGTPTGTRKIAMAARNARGLVGFRAKGWFFADLPGAAGALFSTDGSPGGTRRIGSSTLGSGITPLGDRLLYYAGLELWATDGTTTGTRRHATLPGTADASFPPIVAAAGRAYFFRFNTGRRELWTTDGTPAGTRLVISTSTTSDGSLDLAALGGNVAFFASSPARGQELWASDGTPAGTRVVKDICAGTCGGGWRLGISALGRIWFAGASSDRGIEVWTSNLTTAGTRQLRDLCPGGCSSDPRGWLAAGGRVYFLTDDGMGGRLVYASDGTAAGTRTVGRSPHSADFLNAASLGGAKIVFAGIDSVHGIEPWISNATVAGTHLLADLNSDNLVGSNPDSFSAAGERAYFFADDGIHGNELWSSDGASGGTQLVYESAPGSDSGPFSDLVASEAEDRLVLFVNPFHFSPFKAIGSDGTPAGTELLLPVDASADGRRIVSGGKVFFVAQDAAHGEELWATDGTLAGTVRLTDFVPPAPFRPETQGLPVLLALGDRVVVPVLSPFGGEELWISDGTVGGTRPIEEIYPFLDPLLALAKSPLAALGGRYWFVAANPGDALATLMRTDLTAAGTASVGPLDLSSATSIGWSLVPLGAQMLVFGPANSLGSALWSSDGTAVGTRVVSAAPFNPFILPVVFAGRLWFSSHSGGSLWSTDGSAAGTEQATDAAGQPIRAVALALLGGRLVIGTHDGFYESDGTPAGTLPIDIPGKGIFLQAVSAGDRVYFAWDDLEHGPELWALRPE